VISLPEGEEDEGNGGDEENMVLAALSYYLQFSMCRTTCPISSFYGGITIAKDNVFTLKISESQRISFLF